MNFNAHVCSNNIQNGKCSKCGRDEKFIPVFTPLVKPSERDWTEDFSHENGNYQCKCFECGHYFNGHKRRVQCKKCATPDWAELAKRKPPEDTKDNKAWAGAWLEGEMAGYAKCMVERVLPKEIEIHNKAVQGCIDTLKELGDGPLYYVNPVLLEKLEKLKH